jgi:DNA adenine methylase
MKTPIRWAGSKAAMLPVLRSCWGRGGSRYIEPFCGSACLFFDIEPREAILSDINAELIDAYRAIRAETSKVIECLKRFRVSESTYYKVRKVDPFSLSIVELAARFLFLNRLCFNGIYRTNLRGQFNVPYAHPKNAVSFDEDSIWEAANLLSRATLIRADFEEVLGEARKGDFVYLDPPYAVRRRRVFSEYHPDSFSEDDVQRLKEVLRSLDQRGIHFVVSYADSKEGREIASAWYSKRVRTRRNVAGFAGDRRVAYEVMASNVEFADV